MFLSSKVFARTFGAARRVFNLGNFWFHLQYYETAVRWLEKSLEIAPDNPKTLYRLGECFRHLGEKRKEFDAYLRAVEFTLDFDLLFALGTAYAHLTETAEGERVAYFETDGEVDLRNPQVLFYMGLANLALGNPAEASVNAIELRIINASLADQLEFFINRFEQNSLRDQSNDAGENVNIVEPETKTAVAKVERQKRRPIEFHINDESLTAKNIPEMYQKALKYLIDNHLLNEISLPAATGEKRYILAREPFHPTGKPFLAPVEYKGYFMEAHNNRTSAIEQIKKLVENSGGTFCQVFHIENEMMRELEESNPNQEKLKKFQGCLLGGAVGDALGAAIEFDSIETIRRKFGEQGLTEYAPAYGRIGAITDDTQMTLFTAEGLLRGETRRRHKGIDCAVRAVYYAYLRWLETQGVKIDDEEIKSFVYDVQSWLRDLPELNSRRAPGNTCLSALQSRVIGTIENPINNSKGCGGVMRVAPIGLVGLEPFVFASKVAAITHGHPTGYLSAGVLALIINQIISGKNLAESINFAVYEILPQYAGCEETLAACDKAVKLANNRMISPSPETIESLGGGWIAEEALAISIYCALIYENDFKKAVLLAVNHSGDSDSTGAITGNILGALHGTEIIPQKWLSRLELKDVIADIAEDLLTGFRDDGE